VARHHLIGQCLVQVLSLAATAPALTILATLCGDRFGRHGCGAATVGMVKAGSEPNNPFVSLFSLALIVERGGAR
jgi:hypothetical protein